MTDVFINSFGAFLPNDPVSNKDMQDYLGYVGGQKSKYRAIVLRQNKIKTRYYALDKSGVPNYTSAQMASNAIKTAVEKSETILNDITYLASSSTLGDILVPGLASHIHAELQIPPIEIANFQSVCASSLMALKSAYLQVKSGEHDCAAVSGAEFSSRYFRPGFYENWDVFKKDGFLPLDADFLRFTLSDGAGAAIIENKPNTHLPSFKIKWIDIKSYANVFESCMVAGQEGHAYDARPWSHFDSPIEAVKAGALMLTQNFELLKQMIPVWVSHYLDLMNQGKIVLDDIDHVCSHYSAHSLREEAVKLLKEAGALIDEDKWFSNLYTKGNTGTASIFIMLEELCSSGRIKKGEKILCHVPESGRCINGFMMLEVV